MASDGRHTAPPGRPTFGSLFREPYQVYLQWLYDQLRQQGFPDIRVAHSTVLRRLDLEGVRVTELADRAGMTKQSMAYLVDDLTALGYVETVPDKTDKRAKLVVPTKRGQSLLAASRRLGEQYETHVSKLLGASEAKRLRALLEQLNTRLRSSPPPNPE